MTTKMAAKIRHVQDSTVIGRRLKPIYEWLDSGNNKKALQEAEKVLKKSPDLHCAKALRCLALLRLGREQEAVTVLDALAAQNPSDDSALQALQLCCRELCQPEKVCRLYEAAVKQEPSNEELYTQLFMSYVRVGDFKSQQQSAMALYKLKPKNPYYFWAVMSIVLQATHGPENDNEVKKNVLLSLAQRMIDKFISENKLEAEQEVQLYTIILELQNKNEDAYNFLQSPVAIKLMPGAVPQTNISFLIALNRWSTLNLQCKELLLENPDRWDYILPYLQSSFELIKLETDNSMNETVNDAPKGDNKNPIVEYEDDTAEKCHEFLCHLIEGSSTGAKVLRGPYLARLELYKRLFVDNRDPVALMGSATDLLVDYFRVFAHKPCCVGDLKPYLEMVPENEREGLSQKFFDTIGINATTLPKTHSDMRRHVCAIQLSRSCGTHSSLCLERLIALHQVLRLHCTRASAIPALESDTSTPDFGPAESYAVISCHIAYDIAMAQRSSKPLIESLRLLETILERSPSNFHCKLLALKLYHMIGCGYGAQSIYDMLDIKHIQLDSLGYLHCAQLHTTGLHAQIGSLLDSTLKFFTHSIKDSGDYMTFSYKYGTFAKLCELMAFRDRLGNSLHRICCAVERIMLELSSGGLIAELAHAQLAAAVISTIESTSVQMESIDWPNLRDNRDLGVFPDWEPPQHKREEIANFVFSQDKEYVKLKYLLVRNITISIEIAQDPDNECRTKLVHFMESLTEEFDTAYRIAQNRKYPVVELPSITMPFPSRLIDFVNSPLPFREIYVSTFTMVVHFVKGEQMEARKCADDCCGRIRDCLRTVISALDVQMASEDRFWSCRGTIELLVNFLEIISVVSFECGICYNLLRQTHGKKSKRKTATAGQALNKERNPDTAKLLTEISSSVKVLNDMLNAWDEVPIPQWQYIEDISLDGSGPETVSAKIKDSHIKCMHSLRTAFKRKINYITSL